MTETTVPAGGNEFHDVEGPALEEPAAAQLLEEVFNARVVGHRADRIRNLTMFGDLTALFAALISTAALNAVFGRAGLDWTQLIAFVALLPVWVMLGVHFGLYRLPERTTDWSFADDLSAAFVVCSIWGWFWLLVMSAIATGVVLPSLALWAFSIVLVPVGRSVVRSHLKKADWYRQSVMLVGSPTAVERVQRRIARQPDWCFDIVKSIQIGSRFDRGQSADSIASVARDAEVERVIVAEGPAEITERTRLIRDLLERGIYVDLVSSEADVFRSTAGLSHLEGLPTLSYSPVRLSPLAHAIKRTIDVTCASALLLMLSPLLAYIAIRIKLDSTGPVFFKQDRRGLCGTHFKLIKFRTMTTDAEERLLEVAALKLHPDSVTFKAAKDPRVTGYGERLRRRSLDELPQLWNVIIGDMSLVGPRPLPLDEAAHVPPRYRARERVRPGLTGPWQVLGRSDIPFEDMIKLDYMYVSTWSPRGDLKLLLRTVAVVFGARGAY
ncbi:MAG: exopolysaccharide biosynthesis polyprenyl glycosylphosphotransferase [Solirubrobacterales bacterium]